MKPSWLYPAVALGSAGLVFSGLAWQGDRAARRYDLEARWEKLAARPLEGRLAGLEPYKPYVRQAPLPPAPMVAELANPTRGAGADSREHQAERFTTQRALADLLDGRGCPSAVQALERLTAKETGTRSWQTWNNLAAAHLACAPSEAEKAGQALEHHLQAIEASTKALELEPNAPEAAFNRALALAAIPLPGQARIAWERYLELDRESEWAMEARRRRETPPPPTNLPPSLTAKRYRAERELLPAWTEALVAGDEPAARQAASELEALLAELGAQGDVIAAAVRAVREAEAAGDRERLELLGAGHRRFAEAEQRYARGQREAADEAFTLTREALEGGQSPFAQRAAARRLLAQKHTNEAEMLVLGEAAAQAGLPTVAAEALRAAAFRASLEGRSWAAIDLYRQASQRFADLEMWEEQAVMRAMMAELLAELNKSADTLTELATISRLAPYFADAWSRYSAGWVTTTSLKMLARYRRSAEAFRRELLAACPEMPERPFCAVDTHLEIARHLEDPTAIQQELDLADQALRLTPDDEGRLRTSADLARVRAAHGRQFAPSAQEDPVSLYGKAIEIYSKLELPVQVALTRAERAAAFEAKSDTEQARNDFFSALAEIRRWDRDPKFRPEMGEASSAHGLREIYQRLIALDLAESGDIEALNALLLVEEMKDRLAPRLSRGLREFSAQDLSRLRRLIPNDTAVLDFVLLPASAPGSFHTAAAWAVTSRSVEFLTFEVSVDLSACESAFRRAGASQDLKAWRAVGHQASEALLAPILSGLPSSITRLVLIADGPLYDLPFAGLWDERLGEYLGERFSIALAPGLRVLLDGGPKGAKRQNALEVLAAGFSDFSGLGLAPLPRAEREAEEVARVYGTTAGALGTRVLWPELRERLAGADVVHLVTHAAVTSGMPEATWIALQEETIDLTQLWDELRQLTRKPLVVLSACESVSSSGRGDGLGSLARPFLAHGASCVAGTLWRLNDAVGAEIFPAFHRAYNESRDAAAALREMREGLAGWAERPWDWASVSVIETAV